MNLINDNYEYAYKYRGTKRLIKTKTILLRAKNKPVLLKQTRTTILIILIFIIFYFYRDLKNKNHYLNTFLHYLLFLLSKFITAQLVPRVL